MKPPIGFVLVTHQNPAQILFLCNRLTAMFDAPPIVVHHDFSKCDVVRADFPGNVSFVEHWARTHWGGWGIVQGARRAVAQLYVTADPDWFVLLSGSDYPIKPAAHILADLQNGDADVYIDHRQAAFANIPEPTAASGQPHFSSPSWIRGAFDRYMAVPMTTYKLTWKLKLERRTKFQRLDYFVKKMTPFDGTLKCYAGDQWFTANRKASEVLLGDSETIKKLIAHFRKCPIPDEGFYHTLFCNDPSLKVSIDSKRYADWTGMYAHPRTLTEADYPALMASSAHFARKFDFDEPSLRALDALVDQVSPH